MCPFNLGELSSLLIVQNITNYALNGCWFYILCDNEHTSLWTEELIYVEATVGTMIVLKDTMNIAHSIITPP